MEWKKEEAVRAQSTAESMIAERNFRIAKDLAFKAWFLYPEQEGISRILAMTDVFLSAEKKINDEVDWYGVLGVNPLADDETIKKKYRKLALLLHPDKNNSVGATDALKLINEARRLLSDETEREAYNKRMGYTAGPSKSSGPTAYRWAPAGGSGSSTKVPFAYPWAHTGEPSTSGGPSTYSWAHAGGSSMSSGPSTSAGPSTYSWAQACGSCPSASARPSSYPWAHTGGPSTYKGPSSSTWAHGIRSSWADIGGGTAPRTRRTGRGTYASRPTDDQRSDIFWTVCNNCRTYFTYDRRYRQRYIRCERCDNPFLAEETPRPIGRSRSHRERPWPPPRENAG